ncbi:UDP-N-acetylglucosamine transferase subunit ALG13-like protein [Armadillidium vulgare]|nr:UDP-N-acetylglucosamine transferase subunit ALG13-like protein [Armadillidium vulgare]
MTKNAFVTVGSTQFDDLVKEVTKKDILKTLHNKGYRSLTVQIGKGSYVPNEGVFEGVSVSVFRYKNSLEKDFIEADLIISHGGAGSCIEALEAKKNLIIVINHSLMHNHQTELADALAEEGYAKWCYTNTLLTTLEEFDSRNIVEYIPGNPQKLTKYLDSLFIFKD